MTREMFSLFALVSPVDSGTVWQSWLRFCLAQEERHGFAFTHLGCETASLHPDGIRTRSRYLKRVEAAVGQGEAVRHLSLYLLPKGFRQAVFDFRVYMGLALGGQGSYCEITWEKGFPEDLCYQDVLCSLRELLRIEGAEVNLLPFTQTFNYNVNCILSPSPGSRERDYGLIEQIYREP